MFDAPEVDTQGQKMPTDRGRRKWYAVYTRPRTEKAVNKRLLESGIEVFLPLQTEYREWSDRKKKVIVPLIRSYLFVHVTPIEFPVVFQTFGVVKFISFEGKPVAIPQNQIDVLKLLIDSDVDLEVSTEKFSKGDLIEVTSGPLKSLTGELVQFMGKRRVLIRIDSLDHNIILTIPKALLKKI